MKRRASPSVSVSPMRSWPWFGMPMMSPAQASSASSRSAARNSTGFVIAIGLPVRTWCSFMPRSKCPEARRTKATRSRCLGSMLAWTLKTKPVTGGLLRGRSARGSARCGPAAAGRSAPMPSISSCTPKELIAEPNQIGRQVARRGSPGGRRRAAARAPSRPPRAAWRAGRRGRARPCVGRRGRRSGRVSATRLRSARSISSSRSCSMS